jgi:hypothetical protein
MLAETLAASVFYSPLPWTRRRRVYALLGVARRYGAARVNEVCAIALTAEMTDVRRLQRMLEQAATPSAAASTAPLPRVADARLRGQPQCGSFATGLDGSVRPT